LFRKFEQDLTDKRIERAIFNIKSIDGSGPELIYENEEIRVESFF